MFISYGLMRAKSIGIYIGFGSDNNIIHCDDIFWKCEFKPFLEIFEDRLTGILLIDAVGIGVLIFFASIN